MDKNMYILKTDQSGNLLWERSIGGGGTEIARDVVELADGSLIVAGYSEKSTGDNYNVMVLRIDSSGEYVWSKTYGEDGPEIARSVILNKEGQLILTGDTGSTTTGNRDILLMCINTDGDKIWEKTYHKDNYDSGYEATEIPGGGYYVIGHGDVHGSDFLEMAVVKTDSAGNCLSHNLFEATTRFYDYGKSVAISPDGTIAYMGLAKKKTTRENKLFLIMIDPVGRTTMNSWFDLKGSSWCTAIIADVDNNFVIAGQTTDQHRLYMPWLLKIQNPSASGIADNRIPDHSLLNCYPNPFSEQLTVQFSRESGSPARISIMNLAGTVLGSWVIDDNITDTFTLTGYSIKGRSMEPGMYIIKYTTPRSSGCQKVLYLH